MAAMVEQTFAGQMRCDLMASNANPWDEYAAEYGQFIARREQADLERDAILCRMLDLLGDLTGREVLDAGCGEGFLARVLVVRGARVMGLNLSPRLVQMAREKDPHGAIDYRVADLSRPLPELAERFDRIGSHLVLNHVADHRGFAATLASLARPGARCARLQQPLLVCRPRADRGLLRTRCPGHLPRHVRAGS
jgi:2-polyprenyl-3-methyl-5-hydroxy-6-metoxy-1,4-benzoquinol methylase